MLKEIKKINSGIVQLHKWKFYNDFQFLKSDLIKEKKKTIRFENDEVGKLIKIFSENPAFWNHHFVEYGDRNLRELLLGKLVEEFKV